MRGKTFAAKYECACSFMLFVSRFFQTIAVNNEMEPNFVRMKVPELKRVLTVAPRYNEASRYRKKMFVIAGSSLQRRPRYNELLVNNKNIRYSGVTNLNQAEQWDIHHAKHVYRLAREQLHLNKAKL